MEKRQDIDFGILCSELEQGVIAGNEAKCRDIVGRILDNYIFLDMTIEERPPPKNRMFNRNLFRKVVSTNPNMNYHLFF